MTLLQKPLLQTFFFFILFATLSTKAQMPSLPTNGWMPDKRAYNISFQWHSDTANGVREPHAAILVPIQLPGCRETFFMQFDLGSTYSLFYRNKLLSIAEKYPSAMGVTNTIDQLRDFYFRIGTRNIGATSIAVKQFDSSGIDWKEKHIIIGTLGADFIEGKILMIDYPNQKIHVNYRITTKKAGALVWQDFIFANRSVLLPAVIKGKKTMLYFDTGSSAFELLTDKATCLMLADSGAIPSIYPVNSWERIFVANTFTTRDSMSIGGRLLPIRRATYIEGASETQVQQMMKMGIDGMTGNVLFLKHVLILDTRNGKFALQ